MENRSRHYGDVEKWVRKVINSCETYEQTFGVRSLILNFEGQMYRNKVDHNLIWSVRASLDLELKFKRDELKEKHFEL
jgi:hypothetical protein